MISHISPFRIKAKKNMEERGLKFPTSEHLFHIYLRNIAENA